MLKSYFVFLLIYLGFAAIEAMEYRLYKVNPHTDHEITILRNLQYSNERGYTFLNNVQSLGVPCFLIVAEDKFSNLKKKLVGMKYSFESIGDDIEPEKMITKIADPRKVKNSTYTWEEYHELNDTYNWLYSLPSKHPNQVTVFDIGSSLYALPILCVKISNRPDAKAIFLQGGSHGDEWISPATLTYIIDQLLNSQNAKIRKLKDKYNWYIVPHANPDGYDYTFTTNRFWKKTLNMYENNNKSCFGVDIDRNWGYHWNETDGSNDRCSNTFPGVGKFSEIETKSIADYLTQLKGNLLLYINFNAPNQTILFPFAYTTTKPKNYSKLQSVARAAAAANMNRRFGISMHSLHSPSSGSGMDWVYGQLNCKYSFTYFLPPKERNSKFFEIGSLVPSNEIIPIASETLQSLVAMIDAID